MESKFLQFLSKSLYLAILSNVCHVGPGGQLYHELAWRHIMYQAVAAAAITKSSCAS